MVKPGVCKTPTAGSSPAPVSMPLRFSIGKETVVFEEAGTTLVSSIGIYLHAKLVGANNWRVPSPSKSPVESGGRWVVLTNTRRGPFSLKSPISGVNISVELV